MTSGGQHGGPWWLAAWALSLAPLTAQAQSLSPGELSGAHRTLDKPGKCGACHRTGQEVDRALCLRCHPVTRKALAAGRGLHTGLVRDSGKDCGACHSEHHGRGFALVRFEAQVPGFAHVQTGFALEGKHAGLACEKCHTGSHRYQGLEVRCAACHADPHAGQLGGDCARCHRAQGFTPLVGFDHARSGFSLTGKHAEVACAKCHPERSRNDRVWKGVAHAGCRDCHADPHRGKMRRACRSCHTTAAWRAVLGAAGADHARGRFPLTGRHRTVSCARCHGRKMERKVKAACGSCHAGPHQGRLGDACRQCHSSVDWQLVSGASFDHDRTRYPLRGRHLQVACQRCHPAGGRYAQRFGRIAHGTCRDCHPDPHGGPLTSVERGGACESCHGVEGFVPARYGISEHARASFPLEGAHRAVPCSRCHAASGSTGSTLRLGAKTCADCHPDPHKGSFDARMGAAGCGTCHSTRSWTSADFDHAATRFPLLGRHAGLACEACHRRRRAGGAIDFGGLDGRCIGCHSDPHAGQFAGDPARGCPDCHGQATFALPAFDHRARTGWPLDGAHARSACPRCHTPVELPEGGQAKLFRLGTAACVICHRSPHRDLTPLRCRDCHQTRAWQALPAQVAFDHQRVGFSLTGAHRQADCRACHPGGGDRGGREPRGCAECHPDLRHRGRLGPACQECHDPRSWRISKPLRDHQRTRFPLVGAHRTADCFACHPASEPDAWRGTPRDCIACHQADYERDGNHPDHVAGAFSTRCEECHGQFSWQQARVRHQFWPLRGAHALADCFACHASGRWGGTPTQCAACHQVDYDAAQDPDHQALGFPTTCEDCHRDLGWTPARSGWHSAFFPLKEGHGRLDCQECHPAGSPSQFTCTGCHTHNQQDTDAKHRGRSGYSYEDQACYGCHPRA